MRITHVVIYLYVDDMLIFGTSLEIVCETKKFLGSKFDMKDLGEAEVILGIKKTRTPNGLKLSQEHYVEKILRKFEHFDCKPVSTPYDPSSQLKKNREHSVAQIKHAQIIGSLMYLMNCAKPDIAYAVGRLSRYTQSPNQDHWTAIHRVLKYLRGTINYGLCFSGFPSVLEGFSNANWISDSYEMKSTSGYVFILGGSAISWKSAKQTCIIRSTMKVEFIALEKTSFEAEWLRNLLIDIPLWTRPTSSVSMCCDSQTTIVKAKSKIFNGKNKHICLRHNIVGQLLERMVISLEFVRSKLNLSNPLTKPLNKKLVEETSRGMGLMPVTEVKSGDNP
ncbi:Retrovirus-related Pol polyprotein from transposon TNT 1-94 [Vitis vinifera]|uniref:Retrovirus-related Pol polyprotein from transposon TNT 1-94 n=1 Tax=Vitis vinifera TaxID=29760 RepID=A0A438E4V9_VITVI|nr:Retrovirus-related Pol polyprotein from transposon TNT 1-94 [Vitis vinifera]